MIHFVGFRSQEYISACRVWGDPDFIHKAHDGRMREEISKDDTVAFANGYENKFTQYNWDARSEF